MPIILFDLLLLMACIWPNEEEYVNENIMQLRFLLSRDCETTFETHSYPTCTMSFLATRSSSSFTVELLKTDLILLFSDFPTILLLY